LIEGVRVALPAARLVFNNVNDFPTWTTASAPHDAVYIEVWAPHEELGHLATLIAKARALAPEKPVSLAAYLAVYARDDASTLQAMRFELATVFSHGATCLLHGEADAILTDPYYVRHERMDDGGRDVAARYYDFAVRYGDLLFDRSAVDVTRTHSGGENNEVRVTAPVPVATDCVPGALWTRVVDSDRRQFVSLIDLSGQQDTVWNAPKNQAVPITGATVAFERVGQRAVDYYFASPEDSPAAQRLIPRTDGVHHVVDVPAFSTWALVWAEHGRD
jgi:dextranase